MEKENSTQADFDKQAAIDQARAGALKAREPGDIFEVLEQSMCIKRDKEVPEKRDALTQGKWQEWMENAPDGARAAWTKDAMVFSGWLHDTMISEAHSSDDPELQEYISNHPNAVEQIKGAITHILVALNELIFYIEGKISVDADGYFLRPKSDGDTRPFFVLAMSAAKRKPSLSEAIKVSWEAWAVCFEEYLGRNPLGASVEAYVLRLPEIEATTIYDARKPAAVLRYPRGNFTVEMFSDSSPEGSLKRFADNSLLPQSAQIVPDIHRKRVKRDPVQNAVDTSGWCSNDNAQRGGFSRGASLFRSDHTNTSQRADGAGSGGIGQSHRTPICQWF